MTTTPEPLTDEEFKQLTDALKTDDALPAWMDQTSLGHDLARLLATILAARADEKAKWERSFNGHVYVSNEQYEEMVQRVRAEATEKAAKVVEGLDERYGSDVTDTIASAIRSTP